MDKTFISIDDFRRRAEPTDYKELEDFIMSLKNRSKEFENGPYGFSYSSASKVLKKYHDENDEPKANLEPRKFVLEYEPGQPTPKYATRSFSIEKSILKRLDDLCSDYSRYPKKECINKVIADGLALYGYVPGREVPAND